MEKKLKLARGYVLGAAAVCFITSIVAFCETRKAKKKVEDAEFEASIYRFINWGQEQEIKHLKEENEKLKTK